VSYQNRQLICRRSNNGPHPKRPSIVVVDQTTMLVFEGQRHGKRRLKLQAFSQQRDK